MPEISVEAGNKLGELQRTGTGAEPMTIAGVYLEGVTQADSSGGQKAPSKKVEKGYSYSSYVGADPVSATFQVTLDPLKLSALSLATRNADEPFAVNTGHVVIPNCALEDLSVKEDATVKSHYAVTIKIREIQEAFTGTADLVVDTTDKGGTKQASSSGNKRATTVRTEDREISGSNEDGGNDQRPRPDPLGWFKDNLGW